ncbi:MAG: hypothetical protein NPIRA02_33070 [Nitrospirales bacterium]|nr:MAG: hypothetical protein NPIRA02_33070 [Nitrospirales bacterium]
MESLPEFVGTVHIFLGPYRGNPIALYMRREESVCHISPRVYPWNQTVGSGETPNKAAAAFEVKWKENDLSAEMYSGPHWEGGIKPEKPKPPPKPAAPKPPASEITGEKGTPKTPSTATAPTQAKAASPQATQKAVPSPPQNAQPVKTTETPPSSNITPNQEAKPAQTSE